MSSLTDKWQESPISTNQRILVRSCMHISDVNKGRGFTEDKKQATTTKFSRISLESFAFIIICICRYCLALIFKTTSLTRVSVLNSWTAVTPRHCLHDDSPTSSTLHPYIGGGRQYGAESDKKAHRCHPLISIVTHRCHPLIQIVGAVYDKIQHQHWCSYRTNQSVLRKWLELVTF